MIQVDAHVDWRGENVIGHALLKSTLAETWRGIRVSFRWQITIPNPCASSRSVYLGRRSDSDPDKIWRVSAKDEELSLVEQILW